MASKATKTRTSVSSKLISIVIDIGKDVFHIVGFDDNGKIALRRKFRRLALEAELQKLPRCIVGMEACLSAHFVSRRLRALGFEPRIIPAIYVKPFSKGQKNTMSVFDQDQCLILVSQPISRIQATSERSPELTPPGKGRWT